MDGEAPNLMAQQSDWKIRVGEAVSNISRYCVQQPSTLAYLLMFVVLSYLMIAPIWTVRYLPLGDLPDHAGQIRAIMEFEYYRDEYYVNWFTPYLLAYVLTMAFALVMPVAIAIKVVLSLCLLAFPVGIALLLRQLNGDRFWVISAFPVGYSFSFFWGFYSCVVGTAVAVFFLAYMVAYAKRDLDIKGFLLTAGFSLLLFFAHVIPWGFAACVAPLVLFIYNDFKTTLKKLTAVYAILPVVAYWMSITGSGGGATVAPGHYLEHIVGRVLQEVNYFIDTFHERTEKNHHQLRVKELFSFAIGRPPLWDYIVLSLYLMIWPLLVNARLTFDYRRWLPLLLVVALFMLVPYYLFESFYVYFRFAAFLFPVVYFLFDRKPTRLLAGGSTSVRVFRAGAIGLALVSCLLLLRGNAATFESFRENDNNFAAILDEMEPDKDMIFLIFEQESQLQFTPPYMHFGGWYQAEKRGSYIFSFAHDPIAHSVPLRYKGEPWPSPSSWNAGEFNWRKHQGERFDYFLVRSKTPRDYLFRASRGDVVLLAQHGMWYLYGKREYAQE